MILVIRISGDVEIPMTVKETLFRLRMRRKYTAVLLKDTEETKAVLKKIRNFIAYGPINKETLSLLVEKRALSLNKNKIDSKKVIELIEKKGLSEAGIKPYFRLHPPLGGIDSKIHYPIKKGVLGDNKEDINELVRRML